MTAPVLGYVYSPDAWWWTATAEGRDRDILVGLYYPDGGCVWEFNVVEVTHVPKVPPLLRHMLATAPVPELTAKVLGLQVRVFDDSWAAYAAIPEFFTGLTQMVAAAKATGQWGAESPLRLEDVRSLCNDLGYADLTPKAPS